MDSELGVRRGKGYDSASVSVSVSSPEPFDRLAGLPPLLNTFTVSSPASFSAKCTLGVLGALWARKCLRCSGANLPATLGEDNDDLSEDLRGLPLDRMIGVLGVRGRELDCGGEGGVKSTGLSVTGDDVGNGTAFVDDEDTRFDLGI